MLSSKTTGIVDYDGVLATKNSRKTSHCQHPQNDLISEQLIGQEMILEMWV